jgi:hypothetical protein
LPMRAWAMSMWLAFPSVYAHAASDVDAAEKAYTTVDYSACRDRAKSALQTPATRPERVKAYKYLGLCSAALSDVDAARDAFRTMLLIDRQARLPEGLSPRFTSSFREAKGSLTERDGLELAALDDRIDGNRRMLTIALNDDDMLVHRITWRAAGGADTAVKPSSTFELSVPNNVDIELRAVDEHQGELFLLSLPTSRPADVVELPPPGPVVDEGQGPNWWVIGGFGVGALVVLGGAGAAAAWFMPPARVQARVGVDAP